MGIIAIVGRPNVGKSSLFNRLLGRREAIVDDFPGVTRDRLYGRITHEERSFYIVDTGGIAGEIKATSDEIISKMERQVAHAIGESDAVVFVLDGMDGATPVDLDIAAMLRRSGKQVVVAVNKMDTPERMEALYDIYALGFERTVAVSAAHNWNIGELLDSAVELLPDDDDDFEEDEDIPVAIVGRPNVGKSSLLNALAGEERSLVSDTPGTTRDVVDSVVEIDGTRFRFLDTAGLRRKARVKEDIEFYSTVRTYQAIDKCRVAIVVFDAEEIATDQDKRLIGAVLERGKGLVIAVNKWDLAPGDEKVGDRVRKKLRDEMPFALHAPKVFTSALTGRGMKKMTDAIVKTDENRRRRITTSELNRLVREVLVFERMPGDGKGHSLKIKYCSQVDGAPPAFLFFVNDPKLSSRPFERRLENILRGMADFDGTPMRIFFRSSSDGSDRR